MPIPPPIKAELLWHPGEVAMQRTVGVAERMEVFGPRVIRDFMPEQHREFYRQLPFVALGAVDPEGYAWATLIAAQPGFATSLDPRTLRLDIPRDARDPADPGMNDGDAIGLLGIELHSRRRNRLNGTIRRDDDAGFAVVVEHAFGNCPQYIQLRDWQFGTVPGEHGDVRRLERLDARGRAMIAGADTFFVASYVDSERGARQVDVSHRGGRPGFVRVDADDTLTIPDFAGNLHFNTLGNFRLNPRAGLVFVDFETGDLCHLSGQAELVLDSPEIAAFQGAERLWRFRPRIVVLRERAVSLRWTLRDWSPNTLMTGSWEEVAERRRAAEHRSGWRKFRVGRIEQESTVIRSFYLEPDDGAGLIVHKAGQHLPLRLEIPGVEKPVLRTYTLTTAPSDNAYRISVKRQGLASEHLHDVIRVGDVIEARAPAGDFTIDAAERRPAVLMAAGVGVTPMLAMLRHIIYEGLRTRRVRPTWLLYAARSRAERAFDAEIGELVQRSGGAVRLVRLLAHPEDDSRPGVDHDALGRLDMALLRRTLGFDDYDFYLCGPPLFMQATYDGLRELNVADARIHAEAFGPASLKRRADADCSERAAKSRAGPSAEPVAVAFTASGKEARWTSSRGSLLELAEARGLSPEFRCRSGSCGTCRTPIVEGAVAYPVQPSFVVDEREALICCAVPADRASGGGDRLLLDL